MPSTVTPFFIPPALEEVITSGMESIEDRVPHILTETWMVPPRWLALFLPEERERGYREEVAYSIARTTIGKALERARNSHEVVLASFGEGVVEQEIENLIEWLELFHPLSMVELDYGGLAHYLDGTLKADGLAGIEDDGSIEDVMDLSPARAITASLHAGALFRRSNQRCNAPCQLTPFSPILPDITEQFGHCPMVLKGDRPMNRIPEAETLLTPREVADLFGVDPKTVTRWAKAGKLTSIRTLGGHRRYRKSEVDDLRANYFKSNS
jgi:excisionase family DNA binding protein